MNNFNRLNTVRQAREAFAAALDAELLRLTGSGAEQCFTPLEFNRLFNSYQVQTVSLQQFAQLQTSARANRHLS